MAFITQLPTKPSLAELLGTGISRGLETGLKRRAALQQALALQQQKGLTPYQQISTELREKEQLRKTENAVTRQLQTFASPEFGELLKMEDIPGVGKNVMDLVKEGTPALEALQIGMRGYSFQKSGLKETALPKFKSGKAESLKKDVINSLQERNITNPTLINRELLAKKWPVKERKEVLQELRGIKIKKREEAKPKKVKKIKFNPKNPVHLKKRETALDRAGGNRTAASKILAEEFIL